MKKFLGLLLLFFISACAGSSSTPAPVPATTPTRIAAPTSAPQVTAKPQPTTPALAVSNAKQQKQPDGSSLTTANISTQDSIGVGQIDIANPTEMKLGDSASIRLRLSPTLQLASLTSNAAPAKTPDLPSVVYRVSGSVQLYPIMMAQLRGTTFDIDQKQPVSRLIESNKPVEWIWVVKPTTAGQQELVIELSIPILVNGVDTQMNTNVLQDLAVSIQVNAPPPPPTPEVTQRIMDSMVNNAGAIIVAIIGVLGTIIGGIIALANRKKS